MKIVIIQVLNFFHISIWRQPGNPFNSLKADLILNRKGPLLLIITCGCSFVLLWLAVQDIYIFFQVIILKYLLHMDYTETVNFNQQIILPTDLNKADNFFYSINTIHLNIYNKIYNLVTKIGNFMYHTFFMWLWRIFWCT